MPPPDSIDALTAGGHSGGNRITLFTDGDDVFDAAFQAIGTARRRAWIEVYIFAPDEAGRPMLDALTAAARRGVDVLLIFDRIGSRGIGSRDLAPLVAAGARVVCYNPIVRSRLGRRLASIRHRDHRKIYVIDEAGFCGGRNLTTDYGGPGPERFYDVTLRLDGPAVEHLAALVLGTLRQATGEHRPLPAAPPAQPGGTTAHVLPLDASTGQHALDEAVVAALAGAQHACYVTTPYFVPPPPLLDALLGAARRGVDLRLLTAGLSDIPAARVAGRHLYRRLLDAGARIYEMIYPTLHAKYLTIDERYSLVGSYNFDVQGSRHNLEVGVATEDQELTQALDTYFFSNLERSIEITRAGWQPSALARFGQWLAFCLAHL